MSQENENWIEITLESELPIKGLYFAYYKMEKKVTAIEFDPNNTIDKKLFKKMFSHYKKMHLPEPPIV
jgi:hypothetical protein